MKSFVNGLVEDAPKETPQQKTETKPETPEKEEPKKVNIRPVVKPTLNEVTGQSLDKTCGKNLCIIGFVQTETPELDELNILEGLLDKFYKDGRFTFAWASCAKQQDLCEKLSISQSTLVVYNHKRQKYAKSSAFTEADAIPLLERARGGDLSYAKVEL
eukprot:TRINITY_DN2782_c0_g2_i1.p1 TRINITY_DN2782_c0_g2~~TRINITY_DN2782_c0_g2_i1.p1  ORF type:complete len:159 (-),score=28.05 TRINITY_DN2782_c0_g2_i1:516-992(-)